MRIEPPFAIGSRVIYWCAGVGSVLLVRYIPQAMERRTCLSKGPMLRTGFRISTQCDPKGPTTRARPNLVIHEIGLALSGALARACRWSRLNVGRGSSLFIDKTHMNYSWFGSEFRGPNKIIFIL
ncbi:hypothetical protein CRG98_015273 [Punica granatum]|uniref:Uncharacterized protein n=1 Tax=Punica granatum TaxID=22663 RepID=A0A2I0K827_PUNGR|nr:hypothetical protein CRG98_015273 [Punica granatum]